LGHFFACGGAERDFGGVDWRASAEVVIGRMGRKMDPWIVLYQVPYQLRWVQCMHDKLLQSNEVEVEYIRK
jgi:hypothetical protein